MVFSCSICSEPLDKPHATNPGDALPQVADAEGGSKIMAAPCGHVFHTYCITKWTAGRLPSSGSCPCCRTQIQNDCLPLFPDSYEVYEEPLPCLEELSPSPSSSSSSSVAAPEEEAAAALEQEAAAAPEEEAAAAPEEEAAAAPEEEAAAAAAISPADQNATADQILHGIMVDFQTEFVEEHGKLRNTLSKLVEDEMAKLAIYAWERGLFDSEPKRLAAGLKRKHHT